MIQYRFEDTGLNPVFTGLSVTVFRCSAPQQGEASEDFLKSCSADGVSCTPETNAVAEEEGNSELVTQISHILISASHKLT